MRDTVFVWIPKAAGTSIFSVLEQHGCRKLKNPDEFKAFNNSGSVTFGHVSVKHLLDYGYIKRDYYLHAFKFCFVRNPWDRLVSLYFYRCNMPKELQPKMSFGDFCYKVNKGIEPIGLYNNRGFSQASCQKDWIDNCRIDFIGKFENIEDDIRIVFDEIGIKADIPHKNRTSRRKYREYYTKELIDVVGETYKRDIQMFGYKF